MGWINDPPDGGIAGPRTFDLHVYGRLADSCRVPVTRLVYALLEGIPPMWQRVMDDASFKVIPDSRQAVFFEMRM